MHTPGPWFYWNEDSTICVQAKRDDFHKVVVNWPGFDSCGLSLKKQKANARLISAAPDLLAACEEFVRKCESGEARSKRSYEQMKSAIRKAKTGASA